MSSGQERLTAKFNDYLETVAIAQNVSTDLVTGYTNILFSEEEKDVLPIPRFKNLRGIVQVVHNPASIELWRDSIGGDAVSDERVEDLYFTSVASIAEVALLGFAATTQRRSERHPEMRQRALERAASIMARFADLEIVRMHAEALETLDELYGAKRMAASLREQDIYTINQIRYGIGSGMYALGVPPEESATIVGSFKQGLANNIAQHDLVLERFLGSISQPELFAKTEALQPQMRSIAHTQLSMAGTYPMQA